jgi:hypothetical protein
MLPILGMLLVSYCYFVAAPVDTPITMRLLTSAHGVMGVILLTIAMAADLSKNHNQVYFETYQVLYSIPALSILFSLIYFRGDKSIHLMQIINIPALLVSFFIGSLSITGTLL